MKFTLIYILLYISVGHIAAQNRAITDQKVKSTYLYIEGIKNAKFGNIEQSKMSFDAVIASDSLHSPSYYQLAKLYLDNNQASDAIPYIVKAISIEPQNVDYQKLYGSILLGGRNINAALEQYSKLMEISPDDPENFRLVAAIYMEKNEPYRALQILDSAQTRFGMIEEMTMLKSHLLSSMALYDKALANTEELILLYPDNPQGYIIMAQIYSAKGIDSLAEQNYMKAVAVDSTDVNVYLEVLDYYKVKGNDVRYLQTLQKIYESDEVPLDGKLKYFEQFIQNPDYYRKHYYALDRLVNTLAIKHIHDSKVNEFYAAHLIRSGRLDEALNIYKAATHEPEKRFEVFKNVIDIEAYKNRPDSVAHYTAEALKYFPAEPDLYLTLATSYWQMKEYNNAQKSLDKAIKMAKTDSLLSVMYGFKGDLYHEAGDQKKTYRSYEKALEYDSNNIVVLNNYGYYLSVEGRDLERALRMSKRVMELQPSNATYIDTYAWILYKLGLYKEAQASMRQALVLDGNKSSELLLHYGDILAALGDKFTAKIYWRKALEAGADAAAIDSRVEANQ